MSDEIFANRVVSRLPQLGPNPLPQRQLRIESGTGLKIAMLTLDRIDFMTPDVLRRIAEALGREAEHLEYLVKTRA